MDSTSANKQRLVRLVVSLGTIGALWLAASAPFFQGPVLHW
jgi:hypothetical protein